MKNVCVCVHAKKNELKNFKKIIKKRGVHVHCEDIRIMCFSVKKTRKRFLYFNKTKHKITGLPM